MKGKVKMSKTRNRRPTTDKELRDAGLDEEALRELYDNEEV